MNKDRPSHALDHPSWRERLGQVLLGMLQDRKQFINLLYNASERDLVDPEVFNIIKSALTLEEIQVCDIMVPRTQIEMIEEGSSPERIFEKITQSIHSRFPVMGKNRDDIVGIMMAKDILARFHSNKLSSFTIADIIRPALFIPENKRLNTLLKEFRASRNHIAIVVDEYGGTAGLVTIEDVLEQIVGDIENEHGFSEEKNHIIPCGNDSYFVKALTSIENFNHYFKTNFNDEDLDTVGGLVLNELGYVPKKGDQVTIGNFEFKVLRGDNCRLHLLELRLVPNIKESLSC
ncbi:HlyC/CorC family transporter [Candidatus Nitrosacidococcus sp. I8]|uniref:HlyC/CorC family transporter n=1 Tax=Candidatus Nitrosacidococcus sp. I8 TaxID=2942908 RepID=UPI002226C5B8|nr:transporter associated domain-containing protein [Candidatus Nitrosacidococcus sp. I8]CAH9014353.1 Magnesium and cobalt efflux protein CorC [Candidatus Nitrosacidococcus sp. I8]